MKTLACKYSIWRMVGAYLHILTHDSAELLGCLLLVAIFNFAFSYLWSAVPLADGFARIGFLLGLTVLRWIPLTLFVASAGQTLLRLPASHHETAWPRLAAFATIMIVAAVLQTSHSLVVRTMSPSVWKIILTIPVSYLLCAWFALAIMHLLNGWDPGTAMGKALRFIANHFSKMLAYVLVAFFALILLMLLPLWLLPLFFGPISWGSELFAFIAFLLPAFLCPIASVIYIKTTFFADPPKVEPLK